MSGAATMRAARFLGGERVEIEALAPPEPGPGELLVRLEGCGVCASNVPVWEGRDWFHYPLAAGEPGHEGWGHVAALGPWVEGWTVGERVAFLSNRAYADFDVVAAGAAVRLPAALDGVPFPAEPLACALNVWQRSAIEVGQTVAIVGIGFLGALLVQLATRAGARVLAISRRATALDCARALGADETIPLEERWRVVERVQALTEGALCERVIEATGKQEPLALAAELTAIRGRLVIAGYHQDGPREVNMQLWNWRGLDVINAHEREPARYVAGMRAAVDATCSGRLDAAALLTHPFPLERLGEALAATRDRPRGFLKAWVRYE